MVINNILQKRMCKCRKTQHKEVDAIVSTAIPCALYEVMNGGLYHNSDEAEQGTESKLGKTGDCPEN
jgi:hypothetical protein